MDTLPNNPLFDKQNAKGRSDSAAIKNHYLKFLYAGMLLEFPEADVRKFWDRHSFPYAGNPPDLTLLYKWLWHEEAFSDMRYFIKVIESIEPFPWWVVWLIIIIIIIIILIRYPRKK